MSATQTDPPEDDLEMLAAEYVLGLLTVAQLPHVAALRGTDTRFDAAVHRWELRLLPMAQSAAPSPPPASVWAAIAAALGPHSAPGGIWNNLRFWRNFGLGAGLAGAVLAGGLILAVTGHGVAGPLATATLVSQHEGVFVATAQQTRTGIQLVVSPAQVVVPNGKSAQLWLITPGNKPASLGLLAAARPVTVSVPAAELGADIGAAALAVSIEPQGGSPTGQATGPIISLGRFLPLQAE